MVMPTDNEIFEQVIRRIRTAYSDLEFELGWRFLYSPAHTLSPSTKLMFVGINPGGSHFEKPIASVETGNAYRIEVEDWGIHKLQKEVTKLFERIAERLDHQIDPDILMDNTLTANFCPFRSPSWDELPNKGKAIEFSQRLWVDLCEHLNPGVIICMGREAYWQFRRVFVTQGFQVGNSQKKPTGWGKTTYTLEELRFGSNDIMILGLPHLSRFRIISNSKYNEASNDFINIIAQRLNEYKELVNLR